MGNSGFCWTSGLESNNSLRRDRRESATLKVSLERVVVEPLPLLIGGHHVPDLAYLHVNEGGIERIDRAHAPRRRVENDITEHVVSLDDLVAVSTVVEMLGEPCPRA